ncbi:tetratricopeptide repeat protein [Nitrosospira sp. Nsp5]|uniref:Tetratricopeptide repeat-containing protein n=1 Tax=Nitrosospira multiformis TaxID=1231 RepID=A0ABY0TEP0_9PROT|nr:MULTISPECIES: tetratricopeptide repeat protein [Nitrosospira]PTR08105.1 tetratricopeptide repeat protein [Nitrosospira sp. Nsp5]SDQ49206.1 Tetratricopeptide repeat-containing protein [Nitrosospira multiformis]
MNLKIPGALLLLFFLAACAQIPGKTALNASKPTQQAEAGQSKLPNQDLTPPILFDFLLGETALQRGDQEIATRTYLKLARSTRDPRVAQRATEIALHSRQAAPALEAAKIWVELDPNSVTARQTIAALLVNSDRLDEARPHLEKLLASEGGSIDEAFMQLNSLLVRNSNKNATFELVRQLAQPYPELPEAHFAVSQAAWFANHFDIALAEMKQALVLRPEWEMAAIYQGRILARTSNADAMEFYKGYLKTYPKANDTRITYARLLLVEKDYVKAREQFERLLAENPGNADVALAVGLLSMELREYDIAESNFKKALELDYRDPGMVRYYLGGICEKTQRSDEAMEWYRSVTGGSQYIPAQIRYAVLLTKKGKADEALKHLQQLPATNNQQRAQLIIAESQLLRETGAYQKAFQLLSDGLEKLPDHVDLLYDRALAAEKIGKSDIMEQDLRKLIQLKPDHAHAYNALGYGLAEHSDRLPEALELIEKAIMLSPNDPYIMDSLGWVHYRMGNLNQGLSYLRQAFGMNPDPEIAAHLGEVLWVQGIKDEAKEIWQTALKNNPGNETLISTMKKFMK